MDLDQGNPQLRTYGATSEKFYETFRLPLAPSRPAKASRRLAFSEPPAATGVAKNLEGAFGVLRKVGREVVALYT